MKRTDGRLFVARVDEIAGDEPFGVAVDGVELVVVRHGGQLAAFHGVCPHRQTLLRDGRIEDGALVCSGHGWRFDCASGQRIGGPEHCLHRFRVELDDGNVVIAASELRGWQTHTQAGGPAVRELAALPGPSGPPLIGNLLQLEPERHHLILEDWAEQHGDVYAIRLGRQHVVVVSRPSLVTEVLRQRPATYRRLSGISRVMAEVGADGVFSAEGDEWRRQRRVTTRALSAAQLRQFFPTMHTIAARLLRRWQHAADAGAAIDVIDDLTCFTLDTIAAFACGFDLNTLEGRGGELHRHLEELPRALTRRSNTPFPYWRWLRLPADRRLDAALDHVRRAFEGIVADTRQRLAEDATRAAKPANFLEALLIEQAAEDGFTDRDVMGNVLTMMTAGEETTAQTLAWMLYFMAERPDLQQLLQHEADSVLGTDALPRNYDQLTQLTLTEAAAHETMRFKPVAPVIWLETNVETVLGDVRLPARTPVFLLTREAELRSLADSAVTAFRLPDTGMNDAMPVAETSIPFGAGPRFCPGRALALAEIRLVIGMLCRNFTVEMAGGRAGERFSFTMRPTRVRVRLVSRPVAARAAASGPADPVPSR